MDETQFNTLCYRIWTGMLQDLHDFFEEEDNRRAYYNQFIEGWSKYGPGAILSVGSAYNTMIGNKDVHVGWYTLAHIASLCGTYYEKNISNSDGKTAYIIPVLCISGPRDVMPKSVTKPNMVVQSCLVSISKDYNLTPPDVYHVNRLESLASMYSSYDESGSSDVPDILNVK